MLIQTVKSIVLISVLVMATGTIQAGWSDFLGDVLSDYTKSDSSENNSTSNDKSFGQQDMVAAVLEALEVGSKRAINLLAKDGGYLDDGAVKIPMPGALKKADKLLRKFGQDKYADRFIVSMNKAAEQAIPKTTKIVVSAIKEMSLKDAQTILQGNDDAATQYLRQHTSASLNKAIKPIISASMDNVGVTSAYKKMLGKADFLSSFVDKDSLDLDQYVTEKALDGLFVKLAAEEGKIRKDPVARSSELLKKVFSAYVK